MYMYMYIYICIYKARIVTKIIIQNAVRRKDNMLDGSLPIQYNIHILYYIYMESI